MPFKHFFLLSFFGRGQLALVLWAAELQTPGSGGLFRSQSRHPFAVAVEIHEIAHGRRPPFKGRAESTQRAALVFS